jgi:hypothetical protein
MTTTLPRRAVLLIAFVATSLARPAWAEPLDQTGRQWGPVLEWTLKNAEFEGNPFDLEAYVTFTHRDSGEQRRTGMFYAGDGQWKFRFTGTRTGVWTFETTSKDTDLTGRRGTVTIQPNPDADARGFLTHDRHRWMWSGSQKAFVPQIVMYRSPDGYYNQPEQIDEDIKLWFEEHGFNGLHTAVLCRWFDLEKTRSNEIQTDDPNPDPRTFEALELLITKTHAAGGMVHIWAWGDEQRRQTPVRWGINGQADRRLQRYIAARLGPLPGWSIGYGFDLWEWVSGEQLEDWHRFMHRELGWKTIVGGRAHRHGTPLEQLMTDRLDYLGYETHRPDYDTYVKALELYPDRPAFMEDRFRLRDPSPYPRKDYDLDLTRRGLWHSAMAGGVANIWGCLVPDTGPHGMSRPYPNRDQIRTYATFFEKRFPRDLKRANDLTDGVCLSRPAGAGYLFYKEDTASVRLNLSTMPGRQPAIAIDTKKAYEEIDLEVLDPKDQVWQAPYPSEWAIAVGRFDD